MGQNSKQRIPEKYEEGDAEIKIAYEVSISKLEYIENDNNRTGKED